MKKSIVAAGVSAVALAAMPVIGVFAAEPDGTLYGGSRNDGGDIIDAFSITVDEVCTFSRQGTPHTAPATQGVTGTWNPTGTNSDTFTATLVAGTEYSGLATSSYNVTCNAATGGYAVTVATTPFTRSTEGADTWSYIAATSFAGESNSAWFLTSSAKTTGESPVPTAISNNGEVWSVANGTPVTSSDFAITYSIKPKTTQQIGAYSASATYTLVNL